MIGARGFDCHGPWLKKCIPLITSPSVDWLPKSIYTCIYIYIYTLYIYMYVYIVHMQRSIFFRSSLTDVYCKGRICIFCSKKAPLDPKRDLSRHHRRLTMGIRLCIAWKPGIFAALEAKTIFDPGPVQSQMPNIQSKTIQNCQQKTQTSDRFR